MNTLGMVCISNAISTGPIGPSSAIASTSHILLVIIQVIQSNTIFTSLKGAGVVLGVLGTLLLVIPDTLSKLKYHCLGRVKEL